MEKIKRNEFLKELGFKGSALFALYCTGVSCLPSDVQPQEALGSLITIDLGDAANRNLLKNGGYIIKDTVVIANNDGNFLAATQICSHENKRKVIFRDGEWYCTDHGARFALNGSGLNKDGSKGLSIYQVNQSGDILTIS
ncbi:MAG: cytochrome b6-f complex iron-sulfur subunit [Arcticibacterium sp.]|jgi:cytochrome b6-f complex iron-sulfur subunit